MAGNRQAPERIKPFYETPEPGEELELLNEDNATLRQGDTELHGTLRVTQQRSPTVLYWEFDGKGLNALKKEHEEVELECGKFKGKGLLLLLGKGRVEGCFDGAVELGTDYPIDRVTFHLANYPDFTGKNDYREEITDGTKTIWIRWNEVVLDVEDWKVRLQPCEHFHALRQKSVGSQEVVLNGVGEIRKKDGAQFEKQEAKPILEALRIFLSFAFADWSPPLLVVGSNEVADKSWQFWNSYDVSRSYHLRGWADEYHGNALTDAFPVFFALWSQETWQEPLELAVTWLIEATRQSGRSQGAIAFGQIPLEMLAWIVFVEDRTIVQKNEFERLSAASKLQMLLAHCGIPFAVPAELPALAKLASETQFNTGPKLVTRVRNTIIHPNENNRSALRGWATTYSVTVDKIRWETEQLLRWYVTLVLLRLIGYSGSYRNRLKVWDLSKTIDERVELVPWAAANQVQASR